MRTVYFTDGTAEGFFSAVFDAYGDKGALLTSSDAFQAALDDSFVRVPPSPEKAARVVKKLEALDRGCLWEIDCILRTPEADREQAAFLYIRLLTEHKGPVRGMLSRPEVRRARELAERVGQERHRLTGVSALSRNGGRRVLCALRPRQRRRGAADAAFCRPIQNLSLRHSRPEKKACGAMRRPELDGGPRAGSGACPVRKRGRI